MKVTVIIPSYNAEKTIISTLKSVSRQSYKDFECVIIDDGSTDSTPKLVANYIGNSNKFRLIKQSNKGVSAARNTGIDNANGELIFFLDADDLIVDNCLEEMVKSMVDNNVDFVKTKFTVINQNKKTVWNWKSGVYSIDSNDDMFDESKIDWGYVIGGLYRKDFIYKYNIRMPLNISFMEDVLFNAECFLNGAKMYMLNEPYYVYNHVASTLSKQKNINIVPYVNGVNTLKSKYNKTKDESKDKLFYLIEHKAGIRKRMEGRVDFVVPFVDCSKEDWLNDYNTYAPTKKSNDSTALSRFQTQDNLFKYVFRGIDKYMGDWVGTIHLLVHNKNQVPKWIDQTKVHIVEHKDFIPEYLLPVFNSSAIEMFLYNIPFLNENFLYGNDDMFITNKITKNMFFSGDKIRQNFNPYNYNKDKIWCDIFLNSYKLIYKDDVDKDLFLSPTHVISPHKLSWWKEIAKENNLEPIATRFREHNNANQYMLHWYAKKNNLLLDGIVSSQYINSKNFNKEINKFLNKSVKPHLICINDSDDRTENWHKAESVLRKMFPNKSQFEIGTEVHKNPIGTKIYKRKKCVKYTSKITDNTKYSLAYY